MARRFHHNFHQRQQEQKNWPSSSEPATADSHEPRDNILQHIRIIRWWCRFVDAPFSIRISSSPIFIVSMHVRWWWKIAYSQNRLFECGRRHNLPFHYITSLDAIIYHVREFSANVNLHRRLRNVGRMSVQRFGPHNRVRTGRKRSEMYNAVNDLKGVSKLPVMWIMQVLNRKLTNNLWHKCFYVKVKG